MALAESRWVRLGAVPDGRGDDSVERSPLARRIASTRGSWREECDLGAREAGIDVTPLPNAVECEGGDADDADARKISFSV